MLETPSVAQELSAGGIELDRLTDGNTHVHGGACITCLSDTKGTDHHELVGPASSHRNAAERRSCRPL